jgi:hypothetical protein
MPSARAKLWSRPSVVAVGYLALALAMTWPLASVITEQIAGDLGDSLFNSWILLWTSGQVLGALGGNISALGDYWNGNIFYPAPLTLAYSEHLTPQMLQALPVVAATGNVVLAYNVVFLATIVLSGLGVYLLVRELTGRPLAAFLAGLAFAFAPYRLDQYEHIEVLSSQWMPFAIFGFRRFFTTGRLRALAGGTAALVAQALSCGYYLAYFTPFAVAYCLFEIGARQRMRDVRTWRALIAAGAIALVVVGAFLWPYATVRRGGDVGVRARGEIEHFSADTHAFATISQRSWLWGSRIQALPRDQGRGFPGFTALALSCLAIGVAVARAAARGRAQAQTLSGWRRAAAIGLGGSLLLLLVAIVQALLTGRMVHTLGAIRIHALPTRVLLDIAVVVPALAVVSPRFRAFVRGVKGSTVAFFAWALLAAAWLSLGPTMYANDRSIGKGLYFLFYRWLPGYDGLRVPALNLMIVALFVAVLAGLGAASLLASGRRANVLGAALAMAILAEGWSNATVAPTLVPPPAPVYDVIRALPPGSVVAEFPFGNPHTEILYTYQAGFHGRPILNGYSGYFPQHYIQLVARLSSPPTRPDAFDALQRSGATHAVVHEADSDAEAISDWLRLHGAREVAVRGTDRLFGLR